MHLYLHVPFCARRCSYCDFAIAVRREVPVRQYLDAVLTEWRLWQEHPVVANWIGTNTIYLGGGTPSLLPADALSELVATFTAGRPLAVDAEVTLEANPDDVTADRALAWRRAGFNRVSLGVQSHNPSVLEWMHRTHRAEQVAPAIAALRAAGFDNISTDLIFALPAEVDRDWPRDLELTMQLEPDHISLYGLTVEPATPLGRWNARGEVDEAPEERYEEEFLRAHEALASAGLPAHSSGATTRTRACAFSRCSHLRYATTPPPTTTAMRPWTSRKIGR